MKNILYITAGLHRGGAERQLINLLSGLDKVHYNPILVVMCEKGERLEEAVNLGIDVRFILRKWRWDILLFLKFVSIIKKERIRIVHTWGMMPAFYILLCKPFVKFVWINSSIRNTLVKVPFRFLLAKYFLKFSDYRIANSLNGLKSYGFETSMKNRVIYNGIDIQKENLPPEKIRHKYNIDKEIVITSAGRLEEGKDFSGFLYVIQQLIALKYNIKSIIVGNGSQKEKLMHEANRLQINKKIIFTGFINNFHDILRITNFFILLSESEGSPNVVAEAMIQGIPSITNNIGGSTELITNNMDGYLFDYGNYDQIVKIIISLLKRPDEYQYISENAVRKIHDKFSLKGMVHNYQQLYSEIIS